MISLPVPDPPQYRRVEVEHLAELQFLVLVRVELVEQRVDEAVVVQRRDT